VAITSFRRVRSFGESKAESDLAWRSSRTLQLWATSVQWDLSYTPNVTVP
jgi:hypothetical protein